MQQIVSPLHIIVLLFIAWNVLKADHLGLSWILGIIPTLDKASVKKYHYRILIGLGLMIITGLLLFWPLQEFLLIRTQFYIKMTFVTTLIINSFVIGFLYEKAITRT